VRLLQNVNQLFALQISVFIIVSPAKFKGTFHTIAMVKLPRIACLTTSIQVACVLHHALQLMPAVRISMDAIVRVDLNAGLQNVLIMFVHIIAQNFH
jgi:hypothetical protein